MPMGGCSPVTQALHQLQLQGLNDTVSAGHSVVGIGVFKARIWPEKSCFCALLGTRMARICVCSQDMEDAAGYLGAPCIGHADRLQNFTDGVALPFCESAFKLTGLVLRKSSTASH